MDWLPVLLAVTLHGGVSDNATQVSVVPQAAPMVLQGQADSCLGAIGSHPAPGGFIASVEPNSPCERADVEIGDQMVTIDGEPVPYEPNLICRKILGIPGTPVVIKYRRGDQETTKTLIRERLDQMSPSFSSEIAQEHNY